MFSFACSNGDKKEWEKEDNLKGWNQKSSTDLNKSFVFEEQLGIQSYLKRRDDWEMQATGTGLQYWIYKDTVGETAVDGQVAYVHFEVKLLDGTIAYTSENNKPHRFKVSKSDVESGIQEGIKYMSVGDKAKMIVPSHLGHGLIGDFNNIPPLQVLIVDIELVDLK
ncbi:MAG: FKBP-type peptidyl-prolyl cis-trans isomerase [Lishizhenia sp.]